ncbi:virulence-associated E family protein, partial [Enterococcus sp. S123_ASV_20]
EKIYGIVNRGKIDDALVQEIERNSYDPVKEYLESLHWDGVPRVETLLIDYLGAEDVPFNRVVTKKFLTAAVGRIFVPGIKFDYMLVTSGPQGIGKTLLPAKLAGDWFSNSLEGVTGKDSYEALQGV